MVRDESVFVNPKLIILDRVLRIDHVIFLLSSMLACLDVPLLLLWFLAYAFVLLHLAFEAMPFPDGLSVATDSALHIRCCTLAHFLHPW